MYLNVTISLIKVYKSGYNNNSMSILDCYGQFRAICRLQRANEFGRLHHACIFHGPEGVGKSMLAKFWAQSLLCENPVQRPLTDYPGFDPSSPIAVGEVSDSCGECKECHLAESGNHPDIHIINRDLARFTSKSRSSQILSMPIDVIREYVIDQACHSPVRGKAKFFIIEEADTMLWQAQNALLKTLEEPPNDTFLILITSQPDKFLQTIRSRCQMVRFDSLNTNMIKSKLVEQDVEANEAEFWAEFSAGSLGQALNLAKMDIYHVKKELYEKIAKISYPSVIDFSEWLVSTAKQYGKTYIEHNPKHSSSDAARQGQLLMIGLMTYAFRAAMLYSIDGRTVCPDQAGSIIEISTKFDNETLSEMIRISHNACQRLASNVNPSLTFESLLLDYAI